MSGGTRSELSEMEQLRAQLRAAQAQIDAEKLARENAEARADKAEARAAAERIAHSETIDKLAAAKESIKANAYKIQQLEERIRRLLRQAFGQSSERVTKEVEQLLLSLEDLETSNAYNQAMLDAAADAANKLAGMAPVREKSIPKRKPLADHLPRQTVVYPAPGGHLCDDCGGAFRSFGEDVSETLEYVPGRFVAVRHVRPKYSCASCDAIVQAEAPNRVIPKGIAGPQLLAHVMVSKFADHLPLYRQSVIFKREGVDLSRSTLADWVGQVAWLLQPVVDALQHYVLAGVKVHSDDTVLKVLEPGSKKTKTARLWVNVRDNRTWSPHDPPAIFFKYSPNRKAEHPEDHLRGFAGYLQADAYAGYNKLYDPNRQPGPVLAVGCWAHARRELHKIFEADPNSAAGHGIAMIRALYAIEDRARGQNLEVRRALRDEARLIVNEFYAWVDATMARASAKSGLGVALRYFVNQRESLIRYLDDPRLEIDNNIAENAIRAVALGRKNFLFAGSDVGGERAATLYSLIGTAKLNDVDPQTYLADILQRIADGFPINRIEELLPWHWKKGRGYRLEAGMGSETFSPEEGEPRRQPKLNYATLELPRDGVREGIICLDACEYGMRVRSDFEDPSLILPAEVDVQEILADNWVRAGQITRNSQGEFICEVRLSSPDIIRFQLVRQKDGTYAGGRLANSDPED